MAFGYYKTFTPDATQAGTADSTDWPLAICLDGNVQAADADLRTVGNGGYVQNANGYDIRPYDAVGGSAMDYELVPGTYGAATGNIEIHTRLGTLSHTSNAARALYFGDNTISTDGSSTSTWNSAYSVVQHWPNGSSLTVLDSTANGNNGTNNGVTAATGEMDGGGALNGSSQYVSVADTIALRLMNWSVSCWIKPTNFTNYAFALEKGNSLGSNRNYGLDLRITSGKVNTGFTQGGTTYREVQSGTGVSSGAWHFIGGTYDGTTLTVYRDGAADGTLSVSGSPDTTADPIMIGRPNVGVYYVLGSMDEPRLSSSARSASWFTADYNSQKASSTFLTWGALTPVGGVTFRSRLSLMGAG